MERHRQLFAIVGLCLLCFVSMACREKGYILSKTKGNTTLKSKAQAKIKRVCQEKVTANSYYAPNRLFYDDPTKDIYQDHFSAAWKVTTPDEQGIDSRILEKGIAPLSHDKYLLSLLILRNNALVVEKYFHGAERHHSHNIQSASKSLLSGVVGVALHDKRFKDRLPKDEGTRILEIFPNSLTHVGKFTQNLKWMEVFHLLTMTAGFSWNENHSEKYVQHQKNWVKSILAIPHIKEVGEYFIYSSGAAHLTSALIAKKTGMNTCTFAHESLFSKIGVDMEFWGSDPQGISSGGFNIFVTPREMARFGLLYLNAGKEGSRQIIPKEWVDDSLWPHIEHVEDETDKRHYHYGYFWWETEINGYTTYLAWGYRSQFILLIEDLQLLIISTSDTRDYNEKDKGFDIFKFVGQFVIPAIEKGMRDRCKIENKYLSTPLFDFLLIQP